MSWERVRRFPWVHVTVGALLGAIVAVVLKLLALS